MLQKTFMGFLLLFVMGTAVHALQPDYASSFREQLWIIIDRHPKYYWGGFENEKQGVDCSGYLYLAAKRAGMPFRRVVAKDMRLGLGGWEGKDTSLEKADELDIVWWTWKGSKRIHGHVGVFLMGRKSKLLEISHSSGSSGVTIHKLYGPFISDISAIRKLKIIGNK